MRGQGRASDDTTDEEDDDDVKAKTDVGVNHRLPKLAQSNKEQGPEDNKVSHLRAAAIPVLAMKRIGICCRWCTG